MILKIYPILTVFIILTACTASPIRPTADSTMPELTFEHLLDIPVNVATINITSETKRGAQAWDIANTMKSPPDVAMQRYLKNRYKAKGRDGVLNINLSKAKVFYDETPHGNAFLSMIPFANEHEHTFEIVVDLENKYISGLPDRKTSTRFVRRVKLPPHVTMAYREASLQRTLEELIRDIDAAISSTLVNDFKIVDAAKLPVQSMPIKTEIPKMETIYSSKGAAVMNPMDGDTNWITTRDVNQ